MGVGEIVDFFDEADATAEAQISEAVTVEYGVEYDWDVPITERQRKYHAEHGGTTAHPTGQPHQFFEGRRCSSDSPSSTPPTSVDTIIAHRCVVWA